MRADFGTDAVLERRDDLAARRVVLGVGREDHREVEPQADGVALNLHVPLLQDVEEPDLDLPGEVGKLVDRKESPVRAGQQTVVHGQLVPELKARPSGLDRVDVADHVGHRHVRRRELLDVAILAREPRDGQVVASLRGPAAARRTQGRERVVVDLAAGNDREPVVEQRDELPEEARLRLSAQSEEDEIVLREHCVDDLRHDRLVVADDAGEERPSIPQQANQVRSELVLHGRMTRQARFVGAAQGARGARVFTCDHSGF